MGCLSLICHQLIALKAVPEIELIVCGFCSSVTSRVSMARRVLATPIRWKNLYRDKPNDISHWIDIAPEPSGAREKLQLLFGVPA